MAKTKRAPQTAKKLGGPRVSPDGPRQAKVEAVEEFKTRLGDASAAILTEYRGLTVGELAELRTGLREAGADYKVFKNTLAIIALRDLGLQDLVPLLDGPTAVAFAHDDPVLTAKRLSDFAKKVPALVLKGGWLDGRVLGEAEVKSLASLDSREVMLAKVAGLFASPLQKVAYLFAAPLQQVGALFAQLKEKLPEGPPAGSEVAEETPGAEAEVPAAEAETPPEEAPAAEPETPPEEAPAAEAETPPEEAPVAAEDADETNPES